MTDILDQCLWYNSYIKRANRVWYVPKAANIGLTHVRHIFSKASKSFLTYNECVNKFGNVINHLNYVGLIASIPPLWKLENVLRQAVKKWSSAFYLKKFGITNDRFGGGGVNYQTQIVASYFKLDM